MKEKVFHPKSIPEKMILPVVSVCAVADYVVPVMRKMSSYLMHPAGMGINLQE